MKQKLKAAVAVFIFSSFIGYGLLVRFFIRESVARRRKALEITSKTCRLASTAFNFVQDNKGLQYMRHDQNYLILANHLSYLDALVMASLGPCCFITSVEMKNAGFLGLITKLAGCLFVERRSRDQISNEITEIETALREGFNVVIFPEATSTNGSGVLPFKRSLLEAAVRAKKSILPTCINYRKINGEPVTSKNRDLLCWYGKMEFADHFYKFLGIEQTKVELTILPEIIIAPEDTREMLATKAHAAITACYTPLV